MTTIIMSIQIIFMDFRNRENLMNFAELYELENIEETKFLFWFS